jgi:hypothetical protein
MPIISYCHGISTATTGTRFPLTENIQVIRRSFSASNICGLGIKVVTVNMFIPPPLGGEAGISSPAANYVNYFGMANGFTP